MSEPTTLTDFLKTVPAATSLSGLSMLCVNSSGELQSLVISKVMIYRGDTSDLNEAKELGVYVPSQNALNLPQDITTNTSDAILNVGKAPNYIEQIYIPLLSNKLLKRSYRGGSLGWTAWTTYSPS